jgi:membrane protein
MFATVKRAFLTFRTQNMSDHAAGLTYYAMMSLVPSLLVAVSLLGLLGNESLVTDAVAYAREKGAPAEATDALRALLSQTVRNAGGAVSVALVLGLAIALLGASGAFGAAGRALNDVHGVQETRKFVVHKLADLGFTVIVIALAIVALVSVFLGGDLAGDLFGTIGLGDTAAGIWRFARWAAAIGAVVAIYSVVFAFAPNVDPRRVRLVTPGAVAGVLIWLVASAGFFFYVSNFGKYGATYGTFAGAVVLLLWLYISNIAFLFGAEINAVVDGSRAASDGGRRAGGSSTRAEPPAAGAPGAASTSGEHGGGRVDEKYGRDALAR